MPGDNNKMRDLLQMRKRFSTFFMLVLVLFIIVISGSGVYVYGETQVSISASYNLVFIGDWINLKIIVKTTEEVGKINVKIPKDKKYEILRELPTEKRQQSDYMMFEKNITAAFFNVGDFEIGPFTVELINNEKVIETKQTNSIPVKVKSVLTEDDKDIKPLKSLIDIKGNPFYILKYVMAGLFIILVVVLLIIRLKQRKKRVPPAPEPLLSPLEEFEERIRELWEKKLFVKGKMKLHFIELTRILKHFLFRNYQFNAEDFTTYETLDHLKRGEQEVLILDNMKFVMNTADLVKFAKFIPDSPVLAEVFNKIKDMIGSYKLRIPGNENLQEKNQ
ncbi:MAG: hypothetical protein GTO20_29670 [Candidatus Aminicenantes bacterium]|nr:hypothetical protein [Candidatus Aminicenantes bacterium]